VNGLGDNLSDFHDSGYLEPLLASRPNSIPPVPFRAQPEHPDWIAHDWRGEIQYNQSLGVGNHDPLAAWLGVPTGVHEQHRG
jgi:hypothetical protein